MLYLLLYLAVGILFVALGIPLYLRKVPPNHWYGVRTGETLSNEVVWYEANSAGGKDLAILGVFLLIVVAALRLFFPSDSQVFGIAVSAITFVGAIVCAGRSIAAVNQIRKRLGM